MSDSLLSLDALYARFEAITSGRTDGDGWAAHEAVLDRLSANRHVAEENGWASCAVERLEGGWLRLWGIRPTGTERELVPDCFSLSR